jgi:hypothetical protein
MINFWVNRAANNHVLIMTIDVNAERGERPEWAFSLIIEKEQDTRSVIVLYLHCR